MLLAEFSAVWAYIPYLDLAEHYLALRASGALAFGAVHFDANPLIHLIISANLHGRPKKVRLSRADFSRVKRALEAYQRERYPQLAHSVVFEEKARTREVKEKGMGGEGKMISSQAEQARSQRLQRQGRGEGIRKEILRRQVMAAFIGTHTQGEFTRALQEKEIALYERRGKLTGVLAGGKKYRFRTLGLEEAMEGAACRWQRLSQRQQELQGVLAEKAQGWCREFGFSEEIRGVLEGGWGSNRNDAIQQLLLTKHQRRTYRSRAME